MRYEAQGPAARLQHAEMKEAKFSLITSIGVSLILIGIAAFFHWLAAQYPYYYVWDNDLIAAVDSILIQSGLLPDHLAHPGFGMYLVIGLTEILGNALNAVSAINLEDLNRSLNPLACVAEVTSFLRAHSPWLSIAVVVFL